MTSWHKKVEEYVELRRSLGFKLSDATFKWEQARKGGFHRPEQENDPGLKAVHNPDVSSEWENTELPSKQAFGSGFLQKHSAKLNRQGHAIRVKLKP